MRILGGEQQQLRAEPVGDRVVDLLAEHDDPLVQESGRELVVEGADGSFLRGLGHVPSVCRGPGGPKRFRQGQIRWRRRTPG